MLTRLIVFKNEKGIVEDGYKFENLEKTHVTREEAGEYIQKLCTKHQKSLHELLDMGAIKTFNYNEYKDTADKEKIAEDFKDYYYKSYFYAGVCGVSTVMNATFIATSIANLFVNYPAPSPELYHDFFIAALGGGIALITEIKKGPYEKKYKIKESRPIKKTSKFWKSTLLLAYILLGLNLCKDLPAQLSNSFENEKYEEEYEESKNQIKESTLNKIDNDTIKKLELNRWDCFYEN